MINTEFIATDELVMGGVPCLRGHRISVNQLLVEMANDGLSATAEDYDLIEDHLKGMLADVCALINKESA